MDNRYDDYLRRRGLQSREQDTEREYEAVLNRLMLPDGALLLGDDPSTRRLGYVESSDLVYGLHIIGRPGMGKSNAGEVLGPQLVDRVLGNAGETFIVLDPHGPLAQYMLDTCISKGVPPDQVLYVDFLAKDRVPIFSPLRPEHFNPDNPRRGVAVAAYAFLEAMVRAWGLERVLEQPQTAEAVFSAAAVLASSGLSVAEAPFLVQNTSDNLAVRALLLGNVQDRTVVDFYREIQRLAPRQQRDELSAAARRYTYLLRYEPIKLALGQTLPGIDFNKALRGGQVCIINLGLHGTDLTQQGQQFLGSLLLSQLLAAIRRREKNASAPCYVFIDEFQRFVNYEVMEALVEARGFGLHLMLAHHRLDQLAPNAQDPRILRSVLAIPNKLIFSIGLVEDQLELAKQAFGPWLDLGKRKLELYTTTFRPFLRLVDLVAEHEAFGESAVELAGTAQSRFGAESEGLSDLHGAGLITPPGGTWLEPIDPTMTEHTQSGASHARSVGSGAQESLVRGRGQHRVAGRTLSEGYVTDHEELRQLISVQFEPIDEQLHRLMQQAIRQAQGEAIFMRGYEEPPLSIAMERRPELGVSDVQRETYLEKMAAARSEEFMSVADAERNIEERYQRLLRDARKAAEDVEDEPLD